MTSSGHQWLVLWIARRMTADGLRVTAYDGPTPQGGIWNKLPAPATFPEGFRPDVIAVDQRGTLAGIGEAKSVDDVQNSHTLGQLCAYARALQDSAGRIYVAVPHSAAFHLDRILASLSLAPRVVRVHVPDILLAA